MRDDVSGPIIDALHTDDDRYEKSLADGTKYEFLYRTKIARDFLLATQEHPTHVWEPQTTRLLRHLAAQTGGDVLMVAPTLATMPFCWASNWPLPADRCIVLSPMKPNQACFGTQRGHQPLAQPSNSETGPSGNQSSQRLKLDGFDSFANVVAGICRRRRISNRPH